MYVTRGLSLYRKDPSTLSLRAPDYAPNTGILVITDEESEEFDTFCWGCCDYKNIKNLPFPQNKFLSIIHSSEFREPSVTKVWFLPVIGEPLSAHRYYIIRAKGHHKGKACTSSKKSDMCSCCYKNMIHDVKPRPFDYRDVYQQFEIRRYHGGGFYAKSVAYDGVPPRFLRKKGWSIRVHRSIRGNIQDALGLDESVQASLPPPPSYPLPSRNQRAAEILGRWYCPFLFLREEAKLWRHMKKSMFYEVTLEQYWEEINSQENKGNEEYETIVTDVLVKREEALVYGAEATIDVNHMLGFVCFTVPSNLGNGNRVKFGLSLAVFEAMRGIQVERGWIEDQEHDVRVQRIDRFRRKGKGDKRWKRFGCYVLVETFLIRRIDGILIMKYNFKHTHQIQCKWD